MIGFLLDRLLFCVSNRTHDFDYNSTCINECSYLNFWNAASRHFARKANGNVLVILNGSREVGAFIESSTFAIYELSQFNSQNIQQVKVLNLHDANSNIYEGCVDGWTLLTLKSILNKKNIDFECIDTKIQIFNSNVFERKYEETASASNENIYCFLFVISFIIILIMLYFEATAIRKLFGKC